MVNSATSVSMDEPIPKLKQISWEASVSYLFNLHLSLYLGTMNEKLKYKAAAVLITFSGLLGSRGKKKLMTGSFNRMFSRGWLTH